MLPVLLAIHISKASYSKARVAHERRLRAQPAIQQPEGRSVQEGDDSINPHGFAAFGDGAEAEDVSVERVGERHEQKDGCPREYHQHPWHGRGCYRGQAAHSTARIDAWTGSGESEDQCYHQQMVRAIRCSALLLLISLLSADTAGAACQVDCDRETSSPPAHHGASCHDVSSTQPAVRIAALPTGCHEDHGGLRAGLPPLWESRSANARVPLPGAIPSSWSSAPPTFTTLVPASPPDRRSVPAIAALPLRL